MTPDDALIAIARIEGTFSDDSPESERIRKHLKEVLISDPENFWGEYFYIAGMDDPLRREAERLLRSDAVDESTTFGELQGILDVERQETLYQQSQKASKDAPDVLRRVQPARRQP